ncbi:feather keratin B-4-like [Crotalus adamanteus]|uniref:Feather keratin B-4-like n=1 Tax=Crotalus adamanteus TaxID=8729 RepID=A0AAW1AM76_CROAD
MSCCPPICLPPCPPSCAIPSCASLPKIGLGSCGIGSGLLGGGGGGAASASNLGILPGANVGCISQIPSSEVVIQPPPVVVTLPGPILAASCEPVAVGGYSACASGSGGYLGGGLGAICRPRRRSSICKYPC